MKTIGMCTECGDMATVIELGGKEVSHCCEAGVVGEYAPKDSE